ncbi:hypothetical protein QYM36_005785 [Artemia franciscana]|uniref:Uncharacterized protein n=1 Tax=Artemia franciscana TaxID=6661 RepID=A0AA88HWT9_ARTSF|nr:hypothetical protein QYM36_005785 [Artemia franciscana]
MGSSKFLISVVYKPPRASWEEFERGFDQLARAVSRTGLDFIYMGDFNFDLLTLNGANFTYALGLITTFVALFVMDMAQPALLYLVPFTVITVAIIALCRGELKLIWKENDTNKISSSDDSTDGVSPSYGTVDTSVDVEQGQAGNH